MSDTKNPTLAERLLVLAKTQDDVATAYDKNGDHEMAQYHMGQGYAFRKAAHMARGPGE